MNRKIKWSLVGVAMTLAPLSCAATVNKWCQESTVTGNIKKTFFTHPNGSKQTAYIVMLNTPLTVIPGDGACAVYRAETVTEIQVMSDKNLSRFAGRAAIVSGILGVPETAYHIRKVMIFSVQVVKTE